MPEGHTLHRLAGQLTELVSEAVSATSPQDRFPAALIDGARIVDVQAVGKHLLLATSVDLSVHVHLGMRGKWLRFAPVTGDPLRQVRLRLATPVVAWDLIAPSTCELLDGDARAAVLATLGPDPLRPDADPAEARRRLAAYPGPVGSALLDQSVLAGVGNVFRAEVLHAMGVAPTRPAARLGDSEFAELWRRLQTMMAQGVDDGRIITVDVPEGTDRSAVPEATARRVYKRQACADCDTPVVTTTVQGRVVYACPRCQPD